MTKLIYVWDEATISTTIKEINDFRKLNVITEEERGDVLIAIKDLLIRIEQVIQGRLMPIIATTPDVDIYISPTDLGFTANYFMAEDCHVIEMMTNFSFAIYSDNQESFYKMKQWIDSFKNMSTHLTGSGRVERRLYFEEQYRLIDQALN